MYIIYVYMYISGGLEVSLYHTTATGDTISSHMHVII